MCRPFFYAVSAVKRAARTAWPTRPVAPATSAARCTRSAAIATTSGVAITTTTTATTTAFSHAVYAGTHWIRLTARTRVMAGIALAWIAVTHLSAQVGVGARRLCIVITVSAASTAAFGTWASAA